MTTSTQLGYRPFTAILESVAIVAVTASIANAVLALIGTALGADGPGLQPVPYISLTIISAIGGALGWHLINRHATHPSRVMRWLAPTFLVVSFIPPILVGTSTGTGEGWVYAGTLMLMHVTTFTVAILTYRRLMPLSDRAAIGTAISSTQTT